MALRRARHRERPARAVVAALVVEAMNLVGIGEQAGRLVLDDGVVLPGVPMAEHDLHELVGAVVAQVVIDHLVAAHVLRLAVVERGDHVPGRAALRHQVERGEHARHVERLVVAGRIGGAEAEPLGRHAHDGEHGDGVELHAADAVLDGVRVVAAVHVRHRQPVVEKAEMKLALLQHAADVPVEIRRPAIGARLRMAPGAREVGAVLRLQEADQDHLAHWRGPSRARAARLFLPRARARIGGGPRPRRIAQTWQRQRAAGEAGATPVISVVGRDPMPSPFQGEEKWQSPHRVSMETRLIGCVGAGCTKPPAPVACASASRSSVSSCL